MGIFLARMMQKRLLTWSKLPLLKSPPLSLGVCGNGKSWLGDFFEFSLWLDRTGGRRRGRRKGLRYTIGVGWGRCKRAKKNLYFISVCFVHWGGIDASFFTWKPFLSLSLFSCRWCFFHRVSEWPEGEEPRKPPTHFSQPDMPSLPERKGGEKNFALKKPSSEFSPFAILFSLFQNDF